VQPRRWTRREGGHGGHSGWLCKGGSDLALESAGGDIREARARPARGEVWAQSVVSEVSEQETDEYLLFDEDLAHAAVERPHPQGLQEVAESEFAVAEAKWEEGGEERKKVVRGPAPPAVEEERLRRRSGRSCQGGQGGRWLAAADRWARTSKGATRGRGRGWWGGRHRTRVVAGSTQSGVGLATELCVPQNAVRQRVVGTSNRQRGTKPGPKS
jgi:hypothetical protein